MTILSQKFFDMIKNSSSKESKDAPNITGLMNLRPKSKQKPSSNFFLERLNNLKDEYTFAFTPLPPPKRKPSIDQEDDISLIDSVSRRQKLINQIRQKSLQGLDSLDEELRLFSEKREPMVSEMSDEVEQLLQTDEVSKALEDSESDTGKVEGISKNLSKFTEDSIIDHTLTFVRQFEGPVGGDTATGLDTLEFGIRPFMADKLNVRKKEGETSYDFAKRFYTRLEQNLIDSYFGKGMDYNSLTPDEKISILSTYANTGFTNMPNYVDALKNDDKGQMRTELLDVISLKEKQNNQTQTNDITRTTSTGLAIRRAAESNKLNPTGALIEFVKVVSQNGDYNKPVFFEYLDADKNLIYRFKPSQRLLSKGNRPKDGSPSMLYSVTKRERIG